MGFGKKSDFTRSKAESPPPSLYLMKSGFEEKKKGRTFGCSRERSPDRSYLIPQIHKNPGPGQVIPSLCSTIDAETPLCTRKANVLRPSSSPRKQIDTLKTSPKLKIPTQSIQNRVSQLSLKVETTQTHATMSC